VIIKDPEPERVEVVIGLVAPIGTDLETFVPLLQAELHSVGYGSQVVRMSSLLDDTVVAGPERELPREDSPTYYEARMDAGDSVRAVFKSGDALAAYAIAHLRKERASTAEGRQNQERAFAWIIRTVKHPDEAALFRMVYGSRFLLIGVSSPESERVDHLTELLCKQQSSFDRASINIQAAELIRRDEEDNGNKEYGQRVRETFSASDAFVEIRRGRPSDSDAKRIVGLMFGRPFIAPTRDEQGMFTAWSAAFRSTAFGRQVGAALATDSGDIISTGTNEVPAPGGGEYWEGDSPDHRDFRHQSDFNQRTTIQVVANMFAGLKQSGWLSSEYAALTPYDLARQALDKGTNPPGALASRRVRDIIEFGRITHAEMSAISSAARRGIPTQGSTLFTTTYPCHMCGRLIINAGIARVVYIDPYPKSMVKAMYGDLISETNTKSGTVVFERFVGVSPRLFPKVFSEVNRARDIYGQTQQTSPDELKFRPHTGPHITSANAWESSVILQLDREIESIKADNELVSVVNSPESPTDQDVAAKYKPQWFLALVKEACVEIEGTPASGLPIWIRQTRAEADATSARDLDVPIANVGVTDEAPDHLATPADQHDAPLHTTQSRSSDEST
jgi:cytidine deaminase